MSSRRLYFLQGRFSWNARPAPQRCEARAMRPLHLLFVLLLLACAAWAEPDYELSYLLVRTSDGRVLAAQQEDKLRTPASTMKVVTAAAALQTLGPEHRYQTTVWSQGETHRGRLKGNLTLKGEADPELRQADLDELAQKVHALGIRRIEGDLVIDEGAYADPPYGTGWAWDDSGEEYQPEITGLAVDGGLVALTPQTTASWLTVQPSETPSIRLIPGRPGVQALGELPERVAPPYSSLRTGEMFREHLRNYGIEVRGQVKQGRADGREIASHQSRRLEDILKQAMAVSDNLAMELIYRSSAAALPKSLESQRMRRVDGCGLSRYNLISALQLTLVLREEPRLKSVFPGAGEGTLGKRFLQGAAAGRIKAKTGTLSNISALAGYLYPDTPQECVFAILINGHVDSTADRKKIENDL